MKRSSNSVPGGIARGPFECPDGAGLSSHESCNAPARSVGIYDLEGELFFGAAPDLERHLRGAVNAARAQGIWQLVLRVKRVRDPDAVCLERLEHGLREAQAEGL
jgi:MFS superfamily sulfate permease-like transporter